MSASSTWESFSTFLDQYQKSNQPAPGQMPDWSQNFQLGQRPDYNPQTNIQLSPQAPQIPGVNPETRYPEPFLQSTWNIQQPRPGNGQYAAQQLAGITAPAQAMDPAGGLFASFGQSNRHAERQEQRERNRGGAFGSAKRDKLGNWSFN